MWHYSPDGIQRLEVSDARLAELARSGQLTANMLVWQPGMDAWRPARDVRSDLFSEGHATATPPNDMLAAMRRVSGSSLQRRHIQGAVGLHLQRCLPLLGETLASRMKPKK